MAEGAQPVQEINNPPVDADASFNSLQGRRTAPDEVWEPSADAEEYLEFRQKTDWREPYRIPQKFLTGTKKFVPSDRADTPLIAFINAKSGGQVGPRLASILYRSLGQAQVFDVSETRPADVLSALYANLRTQEANGDPEAAFIRKHLRILVAGGDGSATWVLGTIAELGLDPAPPLAVMPLGTGNDLSINIGWGKEFTWSWVKQTELYNTLARYKDAEVVPLDNWHTRITAPDPSYYQSMPHSLRQNSTDPCRADARFWNYFSVGLDAEAAYGFHALREAHPRFASGRVMNQAWYGFFSCATGWFCGAPSLSTSLRMKVKDTPGAEWRTLAVPSAVRAIVLLNLQTYGGGRDVWGLADSSHRKGEPEFAQPLFNDGLIEVVGFLDGWHTAVVMGQVSKKVHALRLAQCAEVELELASVGGKVKDETGTVYMQLDGEPWPQRIPAAPRGPGAPGAVEPLKVAVSCAGTSQMLFNASDVQGSKKVQQVAKRNIEHVRSAGSDGGGKQVAGKRE